MWQMINYEACGRGHYTSNTPCQDKTMSENNNGTYCIALADGAGSAKLSHYGAEEVVNSTVEYLTKNFDKVITSPDGVLVKQEIITYIIENLKEKSMECECELKDLASTLLFVAIKDNNFVIGHIGDGIIGYLRNDNILVASKPDNGEYINSTYFITGSKAIQNMKLLKGEIKDIDGFVLMSDGSAESFYIKREGKLSSTTKKLIKWTSVLDQEKIHGLIKDSFDNLVIKNTTDDCSIAIIAKKSHENRLELLTESERMDLLGINFSNERKRKKAFIRYETIIYQWEKNKSIKQIAKNIHLNPNYTRRRINKLVKIGLIKNR
ncbi:MAG: PP2C family serine/threonine-protein phosphatase [Romboutsia sp.]